MNEQPKVSIITPSYNQGEYLEQTIDSVLSQDYKNFEYIIIDGGSTDKSIEIIKKYEKHLTYWESKRDNGQGEAINRGVSIAKGEFVSWLNSDDRYLPGCINKLTTTLIKNPMAGLAFAQVEVINHSNQHIGYFKPSSTDFIKILNLETIIPQQASLFRKDIFIRVGGINDNLHYALDHDLFLRIAYKHPIIQLEDVLGQYRLSRFNKGSINRSAWSPEFITLLDGFFYQKINEIPAKTINWAYAQSYYHSGCGYLDDHLFTKARKSFMKSISYSHGCIINFAWVRNYLRTYIGESGNDVYQKIKLFLAFHQVIDCKYDWWISMLMVENQSKKNPYNKDILK